MFASTLGEALDWQHVSLPPESEMFLYLRALIPLHLHITVLIFFMVGIDYVGGVGDSVQQIWFQAFSGVCGNHGVSVNFFVYCLDCVVSIC